MKAQPNRRTTGWLAEIAKATAAGLVTAGVTVGLPWIAGLDDTQQKAITVVDHASVVIANCELPGSGSP